MDSSQEQLEAMVEAAVERRCRIVRDMILHRVRLTSRQVELGEITGPVGVVQALRWITDDALREWGEPDDDPADWWRDV